MKANQGVCTINVSGNSRSASDSHSATTQRRSKLLPQSSHEAWKSNKPTDDVDGLCEMILEKDATKLEMKETLRTVTKSLTMKRQVIARLNNSSKWKYKQKALSAYRTISYYLSSKWDGFQYDFHDLLYTWDLWHSHLKSIQGHFGTGVASYFYFLRWLFICNLLFFIIILGFLIIPQSIFPSPSTNVSLDFESEKFTGKEFLTGAGYFSHSLMYYGYYENKTVGDTTSYNIPEAYLLTMGAFFLLWLITTAYYLAHAYQKEYIGSYAGVRSLFSNMVFAGWDFTIETEEAAKLKSKSAYNELLETLSLHKQSIHKTKEITKSSVISVIKSACINITIVTTMAGVGYLVYYILESEKLETHMDILKDMALSLTITTIMLVLPVSYVFISKFEARDSKLMQLYYAIIRIVILEVVVLGIVVYFRLFSNKKKNIDCWETEFGQEAYRLLIVDFIFIVVFHTLFGEVLRYILHKRYPQWISNTEFHIAWNTLNLIYSQTLTWLGVFYSPMLPLVTLVKLLIMFYMKRFSVASTCNPSSKPWHASHIQTVFLGLTFLNFMLALIAVMFSTFRAEASKCGPFRHFETPYSSLLNLLNKLEESSKLGIVVKYISAPGFVSIVLILFCVLVYYMRVKAKARMDMVLLLKRHIEMEGNDKAFLLKMIEKSGGRKSRFYQSEENLNNRRYSDPQVYTPEDHSGDSSVSNYEDIVNELYEDKSLNRNNGTEIQLHPVLSSSYNIYSNISPASRQRDTQSPWKRSRNDSQHNRF